jgi:voltage-gated potassium channel
MVYVRSFFGVIDLLAILPTFISLIFPGLQYLINIRILRLIRIFRVFKLTRFITESQALKRALISSFHKVTVFFMILAFLVVLMGSFMYVIEGPENGFKNIPISIYWAIVTITTVGYGDISPQTSLGQFLASLVMIIGYSVIAVPTGIFAAEFARRKSKDTFTTQVCPHCLAEGHDADAKNCKYCGSVLNP